MLSKDGDDSTQIIDCAFSKMNIALCCYLSSWCPPPDMRADFFFDERPRAVSASPPWLFVSCATLATAVWNNGEHRGLRLFPCECGTVRSCVRLSYVV